jgi:hypothetical protein
LTTCVPQPRHDLRSRRERHCPARSILPGLMEIR